MPPINLFVVTILRTFCTNFETLKIFCKGDGHSYTTHYGLLVNVFSVLKILHLNSLLYMNVKLLIRRNCKVVHVRVCRSIFLHSKITGYCCDVQYHKSIYSRVLLLLYLLDQSTWDKYIGKSFCREIVKLYLVYSLYAPFNLFRRSSYLDYDDWACHNTIQNLYTCQNVCGYKYIFFKCLIIFE